jgi:hypothetical protein
MIRGVKAGSGVVEWLGGRGVGDWRLEIKVSAGSSIFEFVAAKVTKAPKVIAPMRPRLHIATASQARGERMKRF